MIQQEAIANITIAAHGNVHGHRLVLTGSHDDEPLILEVFEDSVLRRHGADFARTVHQLLALWQRPGRIPQDDAERSLRYLADAGRLLLIRSLRNAREVHDELGARMKQWCPTWCEDSATVPVIHVQRGTPQYLPWELLPLFDLNWRGRAIDDPHLTNAARIFPGLSTIVERGMEGSGGRIGGLRTSGGRLPLRYLWHAQYPGAQGELGFFRGRAGIGLDGPYPADDRPFPGVASFAEQLADPALGTDGQRLPQPHQVLHMSCHTTVSGENTGDGPLTFHLASESGQEVDVPVEKILTELIPAWSRMQHHGGLPLVFLNACSTAVRDPMSLQSLLEPFEYNRNPGVIGTVARLPDRMAEFFSRRFYEPLLQGRTVGEALHMAKWHLMTRYRNPLGLLYALYGSSTLQVHPVPAQAS